MKKTEIELIADISAFQPRTDAILDSQACIMYCKIALAHDWVLSGAKKAEQEHSKLLTHSFATRSSTTEVFHIYMYAFA